MSDLSDWKRRFLVVEYTNALWHGPLSVVNVAHLRACHIATCIWKTPILHAPHHGSNRFDPLRRGHLMTSGYLLAVANACSLYCAAWAFAERPALCQSSASHHTETFNMFRHLALSTVLIQSPKLVYHGTIYSLYNPQWLQAFAQFFKGWVCCGRGILRICGKFMAADVHFLYRHALVCLLPTILLQDLIYMIYIYMHTSKISFSWVTRNKTYCTCTARNYITLSTVLCHLASEYQREKFNFALGFCLLVCCRFL